MLFDIRGKRKRVIQVIYVGLALLMGGGLILFGIGGSTNGGLFDAIGLGGDSVTTDPQFDAQIQRAEDTLATNPNDEKALLILAKTHFLQGQTSTEVDDQGQRVPTDQTISEFEDAIDAWNKYLATKPAKPDDSVALLILQAYGATTTADDPPGELKDEVNGAYGAAKIVADARPSLGTHLNLAAAAYLSGRTKEGDAAKKKALAEATDSSSKSSLKQQLAQSVQQGKFVQKLINGDIPQPDTSQTNPLQGLGGSAPTLPAPGSSTTTPTVPDTSGGGSAGGSKSGSGGGSKSSKP
jgi:hypothetical protein